MTANRRPAASPLQTMAHLSRILAGAKFSWCDIGKNKTWPYFLGLEFADRRDEAFVTTRPGEDDLAVVAALNDRVTACQVARRARCTACSSLSPVVLFHGQNLSRENKQAQGE